MLCRDTLVQPARRARFLKGDLAQQLLAVTALERRLSMTVRDSAEPETDALALARRSHSAELRTVI
jgi:hypothetical protein